MGKFKELQEGFEKSLLALKDKLATIRTGRAIPSLLDHVIIEAYGAKSELKTLATISAPDPKQLFVQPFDPNILQAIEQGIAKSNLGLSPVVDKNGIRVSVPPLTEENRQLLVKELKKYAEETRVAMRKLREDAIKSLKADQTGGKISEDDFYSAQREIQKLLDEYSTRIDEVTGSKEQEILTI